MKITVNNQQYIVSNPDYPYSFFEHIVTDDVQALNGKIYSKLKYKLRYAVLNFSNLEKNEIGIWQEIYSKTNGFRDSFKISELLSGDEINVRCQSGTGAFPFVLDNLNKFSGQISIIEQK